MNPERVRLFRIRYVIGRSKTRTGFENHMLSHTRGRLVPRQPRAFKSTTRTELAVLPLLQKANHEWYFSTISYSVGPKPHYFKEKTVKDCQHNSYYTTSQTHYIASQLGTSCASESPTLANGMSYVGNKWTHGMNPIWVLLFRIRHVIGRSKTRTGFKNHLLSLPRGWLVPRQPRAFKSTTRTELIVLPAFKKRHNTHHHRIIKGFQKHNCHAITTWKTSHRATQYPSSSYNQRLSKT